jgi:hypothetical protein
LSHGTSKHGPDCACVRCRGFQPHNEVAVRHGATSERLIGRRATVEKRRLLRQIGLRQSELGSIGRALLLNWSRAAAALHLLDEYAGKEGWLDAEGNPRGFSRLYVSLLNSERLALRSLSDHLKSRPGAIDPLEVLEHQGRALRLAHEEGRS